MTVSFGVYTVFQSLQVESSGIGGGGDAGGRESR